jgi:hypothetical protein
MVCIDPITIDSGSVLTPCGHIYCTACFAYHMRINNRCGYCRATLVTPIPSTRKIFDYERIHLANSIIDKFTRGGWIRSLQLNISNKIRMRLAEQHMKMTRVVSETVEKVLGEFRNIQLDFDLRMVINHTIDETVDLFDEEPEMEREREPEPEPEPEMEHNMGDYDIDLIVSSISLT